MPTPQVNVEKKDRVNALQVAAIAFLAAALAAGISGFVTYVTTHDQIQAQASQDNSDFLRTQREAAYSKLLTDDKAVAVGLLDYEQDLTTYHAGASLMAVSETAKLLPMLLTRCYWMLVIFRYWATLKSHLTLRHLRTK